ncbi:MAG: hypothetical protein H8E40_09635 [Chloroflexi bacterium]|nr:hypothetical protein [Chloroflexota bacterium]MBL7062106.1 hypothetical protein [Dehalococcoidia bacterium]
MDQEKLQEWKQILVREIEGLQAQLAPIETELKVKYEKLAAIDRLLNLEMHPIETISTPTNSSTAVTKNRKKIADIAYDLLKDAGIPMYYKDLCAAITQAGFEIRGQDPATNLIAHISIDPRFKRVKRGTYALKGWKMTGKRIIGQRSRGGGKQK